MESSATSEFIKPDLGIVAIRPWQTRSRYAPAIDALPLSRSSKQTSRTSRTAPLMLLRVVDAVTVLMMTIVSEWLGRGHLSREQVATLATADLVAVLTFILVSTIRDHRNPE